MLHVHTPQLEALQNALRYPSFKEREENNSGDIQFSQVQRSIKVIQRQCFSKIASEQ